MLAKTCLRINRTDLGSLQIHQLRILLKIFTNYETLQTETHNKKLLLCNPSSVKKLTTNSSNSFYKLQPGITSQLKLGWSNYSQDHKFKTQELRPEMDSDLGTRKPV